MSAKRHESGMGRKIITEHKALLPECSDSETADRVGGSQKHLPETACELAVISSAIKRKAANLSNASAAVKRLEWSRVYWTLLLHKAKMIFFLPSLFQLLLVCTPNAKISVCSS